MTLSLLRILPLLRRVASSGTSLFGEPPSRFDTSNALFLRGLGLVYAMAFASLAIQVQGLFGHDGILPVADLLHSLPANAGWRGFAAFPTIFWANSSDTILAITAWAGAAAGVAVALGLAPLPLLAIAWALYLSFVAVGGEFLQFQWDALLLETGFLGLWCAPRVWRIGFRAPPPVAAAPALVRWLLFRLMLASGVVKLASGDPTWRSATALLFHYETQPLPTWIGWWAHQAPAVVHRACAAAMFAVELIVPFFIFGGRRARVFAAGAFLTLQAVIASTGNYGFFNPLAMLLCVSLIGDDVWRWKPRSGAAGRPWPVAMQRAITALIVIPSTCMFLFGMGLFRSSVVVRSILIAVSPLHLTSSYGLFAVMTTERSEIVVQGSLDGEHWKDYGFRYKPGDVDQRPRFVAPHQPRLDWQMWFAALGDVRENRWFLNFCLRLLQGSPSVRHLLAHDPFPGAPPVFVRALRRDTHFTTVAERRSTGAWWKQRDNGVYCPPLSLKQDAAVK